jgi:hypothetical protein
MTAQARNPLGPVAATGHRYVVLAPDRPGFGCTEAPDGFAHGFERLAPLIADFVDSLERPAAGEYGGSR